MIFREMIKMCFTLLTLPIFIILGFIIIFILIHENIWKDKKGEIDFK